MVFPTLTAIYTAVLALIYAVLSSWVIAGRFRFGVLHGDGGNAAMNRRMRSHANFAEYVPMVLLLVGFLEAGGAGAFTIHALLLVLVVTRVLHPIGMVAPENSLQQYVCRGASAAVTLVIMAVAAALALLRFA
jgi:uncharacterized membrane protein YecN with MAPEG domain